MMEEHGQRKLISYIEENLRASATSGIEFIDPLNHKDRLQTKQNHIIFGRRGAGKSTLLSSLNSDEKTIVILLNLEDYKDISFPNIVLEIMRTILFELEENIKDRYKVRVFRRKVMKVCRSIRKEFSELKNKSTDPDSDQQEVKTRTTRNVGGGLQGGNDAITTTFDVSKENEIEISRKLSIEKMDYLLRKLPLYKKIINLTTDLLDEKPIFLAFDDFYFVKKPIQPDLLDYFHRLTKDTRLYLKVATIKNRSFLYRRTQDTFIGVEIGHDIFDIDLDYTLDNYSDLRSFMEQLLISANTASDSKINIYDLFAGDGFDQLCLASGGVPRDFLFLFVELVTKYVLPRISKIGKVQVNEEAIANVPSKLRALKSDAGIEDFLLEEYLQEIRMRVYTNKRTNAFLVAKNDLQKYEQSRQAIRELVDFRLIHIVDKNTSSAPSDGRRYEAYIIDVGLYENSRPRNFFQIEPGVADNKSRKDKIRAAPRLPLETIEDRLNEQGIQLNFITTAM